MEENTFKDKRNRTWEWFVDDSYFGMYCVRCLDAGKEFHSHMSFHFMKVEERDTFIELIKVAH